MNEFEKQMGIVNGVSREVLVPCSPGHLRRTPNGDRFKLTIKKIRNLKIHNLSFSLAMFLKGYLPNDSQMKNKSPYYIIKALAVKVGWFEVVKWSESDHDVIPKSIAFDKMSQDKHNEIVEKLFDECERLTGKTDIRENLHQYLAGFM